MGIDSLVPYIVGVSGGSGSGKTTLARRVQKALGEERCAILYQDSYYIDQSDKFDFDGGSVNFDHPSALDFDLLGEHLLQLKNGRAIEVPRYDFATHTRQPESDTFEPIPVVLVDGILVLSQRQVFPHFDEAIFVETPEDLRFERRLKRDVEERGRTPEGVRDQFYKQVKPMHDQFVEPSKNNASLTIDCENFDLLCDQFIKKLLEL